MRFRHSAYYEKLALLDAGTIALACNTLLGNAHNELKHRYTLSIGLGFLVIALISLLVRNLVETRREAVMTSQEYALRLERTELADQYQPRIEYFGKHTKRLERVGVYLTIAGLTLMAAAFILSVTWPIP